MDANTESSPYVAPADEAEGRAAFRRQRRQVIGIYLTALLLLLMLFGGLLLQQYRDEVAAAEGRNAAKASVVVEWAKSVFSLSGQALMGVAELVDAQGMPNAESQASMSAALRERNRYMALVDELGVLDRDGIVVASSDQAHYAGSDFADSELFTRLRSGEVEEAVTPLYWSESGQAYFFGHGRRLIDAKGRFLGVAIARVSPRVFTETVLSMQIGQGESIALVDPAIRLIARNPQVEEYAPGQRLVAPMTQAALAQGENHWSHIFWSPLDQRKRLFWLERVDSYPLWVVVGVDMAEVLAGWRQRLSIFACLWCLIGLLGAWGVRHYVRRLTLAQQLEKRLREREQARAELSVIAAAFQANLGILITDARGRILRANAMFTRITGYSEAEIVGRHPRMFSSGQHDALFYRELWRSVREQGHWEGEIWNRHKHGELLPQWLAISAVRDTQGVLSHFVATVMDISERKAAEEEIHQLAFFDSVTGLANRRLFMDRLSAALKQGARHQRFGALLFIDIDHFKQVNDTLGHHAGDRLLAGVAGSLTRRLRESDTLARLGGDEFAVLIEALDDDPARAAELAERIAHKLMAAISETSALFDQSLSISASVGIALLDDPYVSVDEYLQRADMAVFQAKAQGRDRFCFFDPEMQEALLASIRLERDMRQAATLDQWQLYYQPQVDEQGVITGAEALLRWAHPERGVVSPAEFIPLLESTQLINDVGAWALERACEQLVVWASQPQFAALTVSVNISPMQFRERHFVARLEEIFTRTQVPLSRLKLEITETLLVDAPEQARATMSLLQALGVRFSLDDFGTGYSSLAYLAQLPLDQLKIDQTFVKQLPDSRANAAIVESIIVLAQSLELEVIAEGVENVEQRAWLLAHGCRLYQGYYFARPMALEAFEARIMRRAL